MLYLASASASFIVACAAAVRFRHYLSDEVRLVLREIAADFSEIARDCIDCSVHSGILYVIMVLLGVASEAAITVAVSVGSIKLFSTDNFHPTNYLHRTRARVIKKVKK